MVAIILPPPRPQIPTHNTQEYYDVIRDADGANSPYGGYGQRDGAVDRNELNQYQNRLNQQKGFLEFFDNMFTQFLGYSPFAQQLEDLNSKLEVVGIMQNEFSQFDTQGLQTFAPSPDGYGDGRITYGEVFNVAGRDGNASDVTQRDLYPFRPFPRPYPVPIFDIPVAQNGVPQ